MKNIAQILDKALLEIKPEKEILNKINKIAKEFCTKLEKDLKNKKIDAQVFIGGSLAKNTLVKKDKYDVDIFVRFDKKYAQDDISEILKKILPAKTEKIHGSRDYFQIKIDDIVLEIIPVIKIKAPDEAINVTDLSYFHVNYISKKIRENIRLSDEIIIAKAFAHACDCYGAESYIQGFSGYAIELLVSHYTSFLKFITEIASSIEKEKIIIDDNKFYKKKQDVLREMNEAKLLNPIILVDPTFKERNALSSLSKETFLKLKNYSQEFLKNPSLDFFKRRDISTEMKKIKDIRIISIKTTKQAGDISGTKSKKFFNFFVREVHREFIIKKSEFFYDDKKNIAYFYLIADKKPDETIRGPPVTEVHGLTGFKKAHPSAFIKEHAAYAHVKHNLSLEEFLKRFKEKNKVIIKDMSVKEIELEK